MGLAPLNCESISPKILVTNQGPVSNQSCPEPFFKNRPLVKPFHTVQKYQIDIHTVIQSSYTLSLQTPRGCSTAPLEGWSANGIAAVEATLIHMDRQTYGQTHCTHTVSCRIGWHAPLKTPCSAALTDTGYCAQPASWRPNKEHDLQHRIDSFALS